MANSRKVITPTIAKPATIPDVPAHSESLKPQTPEIQSGSHQNRFRFTPPRMPAPYRAPNKPPVTTEVPQIFGYFCKMHLKCSYTRVHKAGFATMASSNA